jgi:hypothetical protein
LRQKVLKHDVIFSDFRDSRVACAHLVEQVKARVSLKGQLSAEELTEFAANAFERYAAGLLDEVLSQASVGVVEGERATSAGLNPAAGYAPVTASAGEVATSIELVKREFSEGLDRAGAALREVLAESGYRHTVSQGLQRKMFEAESMLRSALKSRSLPARIREAETVS